MRKPTYTLLIAFIMTFTAFMTVNATVIQYDAGTYATPSGWDIIASVPHIDLNHSNYYILGLNDLDNEPTITGLNIVFHDIYNWRIERNWLNVFLFDGPTTLGYTIGYDGENRTVPNWLSLYNAAHLGTWSYVNQAKDVVFSTSDPGILSWLQNGDSYGIGIDPDCHFYGSGITVEVTAPPVPEPHTLLLLGSGLLGLAAFRRVKK